MIMAGYGRDPGQCRWNKKEAPLAFYVADVRACLGSRRLVRRRILQRRGKKKGKVEQKGRKK